MVMELEQVANYLNGKFLINKMKADKKEMLKGNLLGAYSVDSLGSSVMSVD